MVATEVMVNTINRRRAGGKAVFRFDLVDDGLRQAVDVNIQCKRELLTLRASGARVKTLRDDAAEIIGRGAAFPIATLEQSADLAVDRAHVVDEASDGFADAVEYCFDRLPFYSD
jgi:hypothetical protein